MGDRTKVAWRAKGSKGPGGPRGRRGAPSTRGGRKSDGGVNADGDVEMGASEQSTRSFVPRVKPVGGAGMIASRLGGASGRAIRGSASLSSRGRDVVVRRVMGSSGTKRGGGANGKRGGASGKKPAGGKHGNEFRVLISGAEGLSAEAVSTHVVGLLSQPVEVTNIRKTKDDNAVILTVSTAAAAVAIAELGSVQADNRVLPIKLMDDLATRSGAPSDAGLSFEDKLRNFLGSKYDMENNTLDLSRVFNKIQGARIDLNDAETVRMIVRMIGAAVPNLAQIDLSDNRIKSLAPFATLPTAAPGLLCLSLRKNDLASAKELQHIGGFKQLQELVLAENPLRDRANDLATYRLQVRAPFPTLKRLDGEDLPPALAFAGAPSSADAQLLQAQGSYFPDANTRDMVLGFLQKYYQAYDSNRVLLGAAYSQNCVFSLSAFARGDGSNEGGWTQVSGRGGRGGGRGGRGGGGGRSTIGEYVPVSRNMKSLKDTRKRGERLQLGMAAVGTALLALPATSHNVHGFKVDAFICGENLMTICVHGDFVEVPKAPNAPPLTRSFNRTFLVRPAQPNPDGWALSIVSDQLTLTDYAPPSSDGEFAPQAMAVMALSPEQQLLVQQMSALTRMTLSFSQQCLELAEWNAERAQQLFLERKDSLPPDAFIQ
eukprot:Opistho-1_new@22827